MSATTVVCNDCINNISPYDPLQWLYVSNMPDGYNVQTGANPPTVCASGGLAPVIWVSLLTIVIFMIQQ